MTDAQHLTRVLRQELALQTRHVRLLEEQERALLACDRRRFCRLHEEHLQIVAQLEAQEAARRAVLHDEEGNACSVSNLLETLPERQRPGVQLIRDGLRRVLERAQTLTRRNHQLIQNELQFFTFTLDLFVEAGRGASCGYGDLAVMRSRRLLDRHG